MSTAEALDYHAIEHWGYGQSEWAEVRDVSPQAVHANLRRARETLGED